MALAGEIEVDLDSVVRDELLLTTHPGVEARLAAECGRALGVSRTDVEVGRGFVRFGYGGPLRPVASLLLAGGIGPGFARPDRPEEIAAALGESAAGGALHALVAAPVRFRVDAFEGRWEARAAIEAALGWVNDPSGWDVNLRVVDGYVTAEIGALFRPRRFGTVEALPASTNPLIAAFLVSLARVEPGATVYDPFCGAGTILVEALRGAAPAVVIGSDTSESAVRLARKNLETAAASRPAPPELRLFVADAGSRRVPVASIDRVVSNMPFGKRIGSHKKNVGLYPRFAGALARTLEPDGLAVLLTEEKRLLRAAVERTRGLALAEEHVVAIGGLTPTAFVVRAT